MDQEPYLGWDCDANAAQQEKALVVKKLSHEQSRRNSARRGRRVEARQRQAGHWGPRSEPMLTSRKVHYEVGGNVEARPFGGLFAMHRLVSRLGLVRAIDASLGLLKIHLPYHESDHVLRLAYSVLTGGIRLEDVDRLRNDVPLMNGLGARLLPDPTTVGDFLRRFSEADIVALMDAVNSVRPALRTGRARDLLGEVAYLDVDGTTVATAGELKQGMDISYKGIWGYAPLLVTLANTREVLYLVNRLGNAPSHLDAAAWIDKAIDLVAPYAGRVCVRGDTDFALTAHFDQWAQKVDFVLGTDNIAALRTRPRPCPPTHGRGWTGRHRMRTPPATRGHVGTTASRKSSRSASSSTCASTTRTSPSSPTSPANAGTPTGSWCCVRTSAVRRASRRSSTRSATSSTSPPTVPTPTPQRASWSWPTSARPAHPPRRRTATAGTRSLRR
jgi:hypothetical protein